MRGVCRHRAYRTMKKILLVAVALGLITMSVVNASGDKANLFEVIDGDARVQISYGTCASTELERIAHLAVALDTSGTASSIQTFIDNALDNAGITCKVEVSI